MDRVAFGSYSRRGTPFATQPPLRHPSSPRGAHPGPEGAMTYFLAEPEVRLGVDGAGLRPALRPPTRQSPFGGRLCGGPRPPHPHGSWRKALLSVAVLGLVA